VINFTRRCVFVDQIDNSPCSSQDGSNSMYDSRQGFVELNSETEPQVQVENSNIVLFRLGIQQASPATTALLVVYR
jgi:hypothetical protein